MSAAGKGIDAAITTVGIVAQPEVGIPVAVITHPKFTAELILVAMMVVLILLAIVSPVMLMGDIQPLFWLGAVGCGGAAFWLHHKKKKGPKGGPNAGKRAE